MAEIVGAVASVISIVLKLSEDLYKEVIKGVKGPDDIKVLKEELRHMKAFLKDLDESGMNNSLLELVSDVRRLAYTAENIIDTFSLTSAPDTRAGSPFRHINSTLGSQLQSLKEDAEKIERRRALYADIGITTDRRKKSFEILKELREDSSLYDNTIREHMVGLENTVDLLAGKLTSGGADRFVMSILGMGGLGKTTLARRLYNKLKYGGHFEARAWICVSEEHDAKKMLEQLIKEIIKPETESRKVLEDLSTSKQSMTDYLYNYLEERSFLVVLDDVWEIAAWESICRAFPQNNPNSRIIITARKEDVAKINGAYAHKLRRLDANESWELFCRKSVPYGNGLTECPEYLKTVGTEMVNKCDGLPLALVTLGGLLSRKSPEISEWEAVRDNLWDELKKGSLLMDAVLTLSYIDLPYNLKELGEDSSLYDDTIHEHMVGLEDTIDFLADKLTSGGSDHHFVMSILGMGGLGKTTLARRLYNKLSGTGHFQVCAWICVSQEHDPEDLLEQLIRKIINPKKEELENLIKTHSMEKYLCNYLEGCCFLVVIDDVWDIGAWERIHGAFPQNKINSRIIITTRNKDVAQIHGAYVHVPRGLDDEESWELFCRKSFPRGNVMMKCPAYLETVGKEMVKKCDGLPLALVTLGRLISRKSPEISEWEAVSNNFWDELKNGSPSIDAVLTLSYKWS